MGSKIAIPTVDLADIEAVAAGLRDTGFIFAHTPGINEQLPRVYPVFKQLFDLDERTKLRYELKGIHHQRGYTPAFSELGIQCRTSGPNGTSQKNSAENWFIGPPLESLSDPSLTSRYPELYPDNVWPREVPGLREAAENLYCELFGFGTQVLRAIEIYLGYSEGHFDEMLEDSPTTLRPLHYGPKRSEDEIGACAHTDINLVTVLPAAMKLALGGSTSGKPAGLMVQARSGQWVSGAAPEGCSLFQVGDMLQYLTGGHFLSAVHKVIAPEADRYSAALFLHPRSNYLLRPDRRWAPEEQYPDIQAADLLYQRLREISL